MNERDLQTLQTLVSEKIAYYRSQLALKVGRDEAYEQLEHLTILKAKLETGIVHG